MMISTTAKNFGVSGSRGSSTSPSNSNKTPPLLQSYNNKDLFLDESSATELDQGVSPNTASTGVLTNTTDSLANAMRSMQVTSQQSSISENGNRSFENDANRKFSVNAPEFVPGRPWHGNTGYKNISGLNAPNMNNAVKASSPGSNPTRSTPVNPSASSSDPTELMINQTYTALSAILAKPDNIGDASALLLQAMTAWAGEHYSVQSVVDMIFETALTTNPQCGYLCARLSSIIAHHFRAADGSPLFRQLLLKKCHSEYERRQELLLDPSRVERLHNFSLFMAELFLHMEVANRKIDILAQAIYELLQTLMSAPNIPNLKCAISVLKCCGFGLEDWEKSDASNRGHTPEMDVIFEKIKVLTIQGSLTKHMKEALRCLVELRQCDWGGMGEQHRKQVPLHQVYAPSMPTVPLTIPAVAPPASKIDIPSVPADASNSQKRQSPLQLHDDWSQHDQSVYFGPDGQPLTAEETAFLEQMMEQQAEMYDDEPALSSEDDAICEAYEEFLRSQHQK